MATPVIIEVKANTTQARREFSSLGSSMKSFGASIRSVVAMSSQAVTGIRQMAQGIQNLGFTMSAMIGLPLTAALKGMADEALTFEKSMVEVEKTTGMAKSQVADLGKDIRQLALQTPTSANALAELAAEAGRAGVGLGQILAGNIEGARAEILEFVRVMDMMQISTNITGTESAKAFSRFITLFDDIDVSNIENLGSTINELGQATSVAEDEIVGAMLRIAPAAATLDMSAASAAALGTAITQMSESMSRGGTRVRVALEQMALNYEDAAKLIGISSSEMADRINKDALSVFLELVYAVSKIEDNTKQLEVATEIFGTTGANAVQRFAAAYPELLSYIELANQSFDQGSSLQVEFDRALTATSAQLDILKNNVIEAGLTFVEDLLPVAQEIISALIPAIRELTGFVAGLTTEQKMLGVAIVAVVTAGLPLLALVGSLGFGFSMIINGAVNLIGGLVGLAATVLTLGGGLSFLGTIVGILAGLIGTTLVIGLLKGTDAFDMILEKLRAVADGAIDWGESFIAEIAEGIISGAAGILVDALEFVGNIIASFLQASSPPETGPLSTINEWGARLIDTYMQGFKNADFSILTGVSRIISDVLKNLVSIGDIEDVDFGPMLANARTAVSQLVSVFNETGQISETILSQIGGMLGGAGEEVVKLLRLQLEYNKALKELDSIRSGMADIDEAYEAEARAIANRTDLTEAEKMAAIRAAKGRRDLEMDNAKTKEKVAKESVDSLKEEVRWQQNYIGGMSDQDDILVDHMNLLKEIEERMNEVGKTTAKTVKEAASYLERLAKTTENAIERILTQIAANEELKKLYESKGMDTTPLLRKELSLRKSLVASLLQKKQLNGELSDQETAMLDANIDRVGELEALLDVEPDPIITAVDTSDVEEGTEVIAEAMKKLTELGETVKNTLEEGPKLWEAFKAGIAGKIGLDTSVIPTDALQGILQQMSPEQLMNTEFLDESSRKFFEWGQKIRGVWNKVTGIINNIKTKFSDLKESLSTTFESITGMVDKSGITDETTKVGGAIQKFLPVILAFGASIFLLRKPLIGLASWLIAPATVGRFGDAFGSLTSPKSPLATLARWATGIWPAAVGTAGSAMQSLYLRALYLADGLKKIPGAIAKIPGAFKNLKLGFIRNFNFIKQGLGWIISFPKDAIKHFGGKFFGSLSLSNIKLAFVRNFNFIKQGLGWILKFPGEAAKLFGGKLAGGIKGFLGILKGGIGPIISLIAGIGSSIGGFITTIVSFIGPITLIGGAIVAALAAVGVAIVYVKRNWSKFASTFEKIWNNIKNAVTGFVDSFKKALGMGGAGGDGLKFSAILEKIYEKAEPVAKFLAGAFTKALHIISGLLKIILPALGKAFGGIFAGIALVAGGILDLLGGIFKAIEALWKGISTGDWSMFEEAWAKIKEGVLGILKGLGSAILGVFSGLIDSVLGIFRSIMDGIVKIFGKSKFIRGVRVFIYKVIGFFQELYNKLIGGSIIPDIVNGVKSWFKKLLKPFQPIIDIIKKVIGYFKLAYKFVVVAFKKGGATKGFAALFKVLGPFKKVLGPVVEMFYRLYRVVEPIIKAFKEGFAEGGLKGAFEKIKEILPDVIQRIKTLLGSMMTMVPKMLIGLGQMLWPWIQNTLLPWASSAITTIWQYLSENVPTWISALLSALGGFASQAWAWITDTLLPWAGNVISTVWEYLVQNVPIWVSALVSALGDFIGKAWSWIQEKFFPWVVAIVQVAWAYLKEHLPEWAKLLLGVLGTIATSLWNFIINDAIPWVIGLITQVWEIIQRDGPSWLAKIVEILGTIVTSLWSFLTTSVLPWIGQVISDVANYIITNGPSWLAKILEVLLSISDSLWNWITETVVPWLEDIIAQGITILGNIATDWWDTVKTGLDKIADYFETIFGAIKTLVMTAITSAINGMIDLLESGINKVIDGINDGIRWVNSILKKFGFKTIGLISKVSIAKLPLLGKGGIALQEQLAIVGDVPEAIIPLDRMSEFFGTQKSKDERPIHIEVKNNTVRSDEDLNRIIDEISRKLGTKLDARIRTIGTRSLAI